MVTPNDLGCKVPVQGALGTRQCEKLSAYRQATLCGMITDTARSKSPCCLPTCTAQTASLSYPTYRFTCSENKYSSLAWEHIVDSRSGIQPVACRLPLIIRRQSQMVYSAMTNIIVNFECFYVNRRVLLGCRPCWRGAEHDRGYVPDSMPGCNGDQVTLRKKSCLAGIPGMHDATK